VSEDLAATVQELAKRVARNEPQHRDPERFHLEKSDIAHQLRAVASKIKEQRA